MNFINKKLKFIKEMRKNLKKVKIKQKIKRKKNIKHQRVYVQIHYYLNPIRIIILFFLVSINYYIEFFFYESFLNNNYIIELKDWKHKHIRHIRDDVTIVSGYFKMKSKHSLQDYLNWADNFMQINCSLIFFIDDSFYKEIIAKRPVEYRRRTIWVKTNISQFYSYKNFIKAFNESYNKDIEKYLHSVPLYLIWAEKSYFLNISANKDFFHSKCFYWIDAGYFREKKVNMKKYINNWPSTKKCFEDKRLLMGQVKNFSYFEKQKIANFDIASLKTLQNDINVIGGLFGGQADNILKFSDHYYRAINEYIKNNLFIGKDQNIYTFVAFSHPEIVKLVFFRNYLSFKAYLK